jgi:hypothetical protein
MVKLRRVVLKEGMVVVVHVTRQQHKYQYDFDYTPDICNFEQH